MSYRIHNVSDDGYRMAGLFYREQFSGHAVMWPAILKAYRRYRTVGMNRRDSNLLTIGYADGARHGIVISVMRSVAGRNGQKARS